jgi:integrase
VRVKLEGGGYDPAPAAAAAVRHLYRYDPRKTLRRIIAASGLPAHAAGPHCWRHTFASLHAAAGTPLTTIARWIGDSERTTYRHYVGLAPHDSRMIDSIV